MLPSEIKYAKSALAQLKRKKNKPWRINDFRLLDCLPEIVRTIRRSRLTAEQDKATIKLLNDINDLKKHKNFNEVEIFKTLNFNRIFKESLDTMLIKATKGDDDALLNLVSWDKCWLFSNLSRLRILKAQAENDTRFLDKLSKAVADTKLKNFVFSKQGEIAYSKVVKLIQLFILNLGADFENPYNTNQLYKAINKMADDQFTTQDEKQKKRLNKLKDCLLADENYFKHKFLKRQGLRYDRKNVI